MVAMHVPSVELAAANRQARRLETGYGENSIFNVAAADH